MAAITFKLIVMVNGPFAFRTTKTFGLLVDFVDLGLYFCRAIHLIVFKNDDAICSTTHTYIINYEVYFAEN